MARVVPYYGVGLKHEEMVIVAVHIRGKLHIVTKIKKGENIYNFSLIDLSNKFIIAFLYVSL